MNEINTIDHDPQILPVELNYLFAQLAPQDVEQFYQGYRLWSLQHDIAALQAQIGTLQQQIEHNAELMQSVEPTPIAFSALAQLQAYGVNDTNLLDRMLERGDNWLDHTVQLLTRCQELNVISSDYTQWCENALEGAYDWITSMDQATKEVETNEPFDENIEVALLRKLMSEDDTEPGLSIVTADSTYIADQNTLPPASNAAYPPLESSEQYQAADSSYGTTDAIDLEALKVPTTSDEEDAEANFSSTSNDQTASTINQVADCSVLPNAAAQTTEDAINQSVDQIDRAPDAATAISYDRDTALDDKDISTESSTTDDYTTAETTAEYIEQTPPPQESDSEEQTAITSTVTPANTVTARLVKNPETAVELVEQPADHATTKVHLQEDDLALPPVTNIHEPDSEPIVTATEERPEQTLQLATTHYKPGISWSETTELIPVPHKERHGLLVRLFRSKRASQ